MRDRLTSAMAASPADLECLHNIDLFLHCCEISVSHNVYMIVPGEAAHDGGLPKVSFSGALLP